MTAMDRAKPYCIAKREVLEAYKQVKANRGAAGVDGQSIEDFDGDLSKNLYRIWNRMSSGSYFPPPVRRVDIPKGDAGGTRPLGIPTVSDRVAQVRQFMTSSASSRQIKQPSILGVCIDKEGRALMTGRTVLDAQSYGAFRVVSTQSTPSPDRLCIWHDAIGLSGPYRARRV
jgi:hypothetical protein